MSIGIIVVIVMVIAFIAMAYLADQAKKAEAKLEAEEAAAAAASNSIAGPLPPRAPGVPMSDGRVVVPPPAGPGTGAPMPAAKTGLRPGAVNAGPIASGEVLVPSTVPPTTRSQPVSTPVSQPAIGTWGAWTGCSKTCMGIKYRVCQRPPCKGVSRVICNGPRCTDRKSKLQVQAMHKMLKAQGLM